MKTVFFKNYLTISKNVSGLSLLKISLQVMIVTRFSVFERLIILYLPELATLLKQNNVLPSYYISPWFITLFTHSFIEFYVIFPLGDFSDF